jgi:hypothetical protein
LVNCKVNSVPTKPYLRVAKISLKLSLSIKVIHA